MDLFVYTDGASRGNPGNSASAFIVVSSSGRVIDKVAKFIGTGTNNIAEYSAIVNALEYVSKRYPRYRIILHSDSQVVIRQINGEYSVNAPHLKAFLGRVNKLREKLDIEFKHVPRENKYIAICDRACNEILDYTEKVEKGA